jgi:CubicO group peptidase (beta-lactamase class C family)
VHGGIPNGRRSIVCALTNVNNRQRLIRTPRRLPARAAARYGGKVPGAGAKGEVMDALTSLDRHLQAVTADRTLAGVVAVAADANGTIFEAAHGARSIAGGAAMTLDTVGWIASMTKAITSVAAMQLVERGRLSLDAPLGTLVPALAEPQVLEGFAADGTPRTRPARRPVTLRALLTHTAGFGYDIWSEDISRYMAHFGLPGVSSCKNAALTTPLLFDPGDRWTYGINTDFVGKAVEAASGQTLEDYFRTHITGPLGMADTAFRIGAAQRARLSAMHARTPDGLVAVPFELEQEPEFYMGGGGLYGTAPDYLRFARAILRGGELDGARILSAASVAEMSRNQIGALNVTTLRTAIPSLSNDADFYPGMVQKWGLGFLLNSERDAHGRSPDSLAWAGLANTYYWIDPAAGVCGVVLTQLLPFADPAALDCLWALERGVYGR